MNKKSIPRFAWVFYLAVIVALWWPVSGRMLLSGDASLAMRSIANLSGLFAVFFVLTQLILISRAKWVEGIFGLDRLARLHHIIGFTIPIFIIAHPILLVTGAWLGSTRGWFSNFLRIANFTEDVWAATVSAVLFLILVAVSAMIAMKKLKYETWYITHLLMYLAILLAFGHQLDAGDDLSQGWSWHYWVGLYVFTVANLFYYRFFLPVWRSKRHDFKVDKVVKETADTYSIYIKGKKLDKFRVKAGQFFIFRFLDDERWWQAHPFSLSCAPNSDYLRITVKALGDYTREIHEINPGTPVLIDGPHGVFTLDKSKRDKYLLLAGGVGITPVMGLAEELSRKNDDTVVISATRSLDNAVFKKELDSLGSSRMKVSYIMSNDPEWEGEKGFLTEESLQRLAPDYKEREIYFCGPPLMLKTVLDIVNKAGIPRSQLHYEKFSL